MKVAGLLLIGGVILGLSGCMNMDIYSDSDRSVDFSVYRTFAWNIPTKKYTHADPKFDNDIIEGNIANYVNMELVNRGYSLDTVQPDILLQYDISTQNKIRIDQVPVTSTVYNNRPYYYNPYNPYSNNLYMPSPTYITTYKPVEVPYEEGDLTISIIDRKTQRVIWHGYAVGTLDDLISFEQELPQDIHAMFKKYPVPPLQVSK
ncbi:MAG: DUF4136 domain-containing protein [Cytophagales bacterium]|nr:DUF4136 domain-containing protein [Cytophagales bacterium]